MSDVLACTGAWVDKRSSVRFTPKAHHSRSIGLTDDGQHDLARHPQRAKEADMAQEEDILSSHPPPVRRSGHDAIPCCYLHEWLADYAVDGPWAPTPGPDFAAPTANGEQRPACATAIAVKRRRPTSVCTATESSSRSGSSDMHHDDGGDGDGDADTEECTASLASESFVTVTSHTEVSLHVLPHK